MQEPERPTEATSNREAQQPIVVVPTESGSLNVPHDDQAASTSLPPVVETAQPHVSTPLDTYTPSPAARPASSPNQTFTPQAVQEPDFYTAPQAYSPNLVAQQEQVDFYGGGPAPEPVKWSASEYIAHHKSPTWFAGLAFVLLVVAGVIFLFTRDFFSPVLIVILGGAFGVFAARQPNVLDYALLRGGIKIGAKLYPYESFKSFSVTEDGAMHFVQLLPTQRFMPPISVYFEPVDENRIIETLGDYLPFEPHRRDAVDSLMRKVRF